MKKILFDLTVCQPLGSTRVHGGGVYGYIVFKNLILRSSNQVVAYINRGLFIEPSVENLMSEYNVAIVDARFCSLDKAFELEDYSLLYSPLSSSNYASLYKKRIPVMVTVHGLRALEMNRDNYEYLYENTLRGYLKCFLKQTPLYWLLYKKYWNEYCRVLENDSITVVTVSEHTRNSILCYYPQRDKKIINVRYSPSTSPEDYNSIKVYSEDKYYLIISANRWLKNAYRAMAALDYIFDSYDNFDGKVIVVGLSPQSNVYRKMKHKERFILLNYVDQYTLESLFAGAYTFIYPSLNEGFGYPPLEAMKYGTPVIASSFSSIAEVCGDAVIYTNPYSIYEIANRVLKLEDHRVYSEYCSRGLLQYEKVEKRQEEDLNSLLNEILAYT